MADFDVIVIGGGPGGYAAALRASELGATVALVEAEKLGGACVNFACIPTNMLVDSAIRYLDAKELDLMGVFSLGDTFNIGRAAARKDALLKKLGDGIAAMIRLRKITLVEGRAQFTDPHSVSVSLKQGGVSQLTGEALVISTGARWEPPAIPGYLASQILLPDQVQSLTSAPGSVLILADGPGDVPFGAEYAVLLSTAGSEVTIATTRDTVFPALDADLQPLAEASLEALGVQIFKRASVDSGLNATVSLDTPDGPVAVAAEVVLASDPRRPFVHGVGLEAAGVLAADEIPIDRATRTNVEHIFAVGDVTGGAMLTNIADHMGRVAGENAAGGNAVTRLVAVPRIVHTFPETGWVGVTEQAAREQGYGVSVGASDLAFNAKSITLGAREGVLKLIADPELGEILGVHVVGPGVSEVIASAASAMQAETSAHDLAATTYWHPSISEALAEAARRAVPKAE